MLMSVGVTFRTNGELLRGVDSGYGDVVRNDSASTAAAADVLRSANLPRVAWLMALARLRLLGV